MSDKKRVKSFNKIVLGIDPGAAGAFVWLSTESMYFESMPMKNKDVDFDEVREMLRRQPCSHIFLERAMAFNMGTGAAFNYGRGFAALEIACRLSGIPTTYIEPKKWTKEMHAGIEADLKPKAKSIIAVERLCQKWIFDIPVGPKSGKMDEGVVDALLIASYGLRVLK